MTVPTKETSMAAWKKAGIDNVISLPVGTAPSASFRWEGAKPASYTMTAEEVTALVNNRPWKYWPFSSVQVKIGSDGTIEASGMVDTGKVLGYTEALGFQTADVRKVMADYRIPEKSVPAYVKGKASITDNKLTMSVDAAEIGRVSVPGSVIANNTGRVVSVIESAMARQPELKIKSMTFSGGEAKYDGTVPEKIYAVTQ
jgi:hypothetical protein